MPAGSIRHSAANQNGISGPFNLGGTDDAQAWKFGYSILHDTSNRPQQVHADFLFDLAAGLAGKTPGSNNPAACSCHSFGGAHGTSSERSQRNPET